jgi:hypothetical protein
MVRDRGDALAHHLGVLDPVGEEGAVAEVDEALLGE